jgi:cold-inducible RNA-binding protein
MLGDFQKSSARTEPVRDHEEGGNMNKNLYVGNLSVEVTEEDLKANFTGAGSVLSVKIIKDKYTGLSRGFGFVEMETEEGAKEAIQKFNGGELLGNIIRVNEARPAKDQEGERRDGYRGGGAGMRRGPRGGGRRY